MSIALKIEDVSKMYRLGTVGTGTLSHDLNRLWAKVRGKADPTLKIGMENRRAEKGGEYVWALKDINLEVKQGEILGIIGRNGAGKSTLLKLLSRVTAPTTGTIKAKGRIASLLEVGTGFHPELTGRENVYLNGAILGMSKPEITKRLDEIVEFSGCGKYIDTPVKRYSSGMTVRLGFAVAAHLQSDILIVDEVLSVGDAEFKKKCVGKMEDVRTQGRTILFVSHVMESIQALCNRVCLIQKGRINDIGTANSMVGRYLEEQLARTATIHLPRPFCSDLEITNFRLDSNRVQSGKALNINVDIRAKDATYISEAAIIIHELTGRRIAILDLRERSGDLIQLIGGQTCHYTTHVASIPFVEGEYGMSLYLRSKSFSGNIKNVESFSVESPIVNEGLSRFPVNERGTIELDFEFEIDLT